MQFLTKFEGGPRHGLKTLDCALVLPCEGGSYRLEVTERFGFPVRYVWQPGTVETVAKGKPMTDEEIDASVRAILRRA